MEIIFGFDILENILFLPKIFHAAIKKKCFFADPCYYSSPYERVYYPSRASIHNRSELELITIYELNTPACRRPTAQPVRYRTQSRLSHTPVDESSTRSLWLYSMRSSDRTSGLIIVYVTARYRTNVYEIRPRGFIGKVNFASAYVSRLPLRSKRF